MSDRRTAVLTGAVICEAAQVLRTACLTPMRTFFPLRYPDLPLHLRSGPYVRELLKRQLSGGAPFVVAGMGFPIRPFKGIQVADLLMNSVNDSVLSDFRVQDHEPGLTGGDIKF